MESLHEAAIIGVGTALPQHRVNQEVAFEWLAEFFQYPDRTCRFLRRIFRHAQVRSRYSVLPDFTDPHAAVLYRDGKIPSPERRMRIYETEAVALARRACLRALLHCNLEPADVSHLIVVSSTGYVTPGPDALLAAKLGLDPRVARTMISMTGCSGAFNGIRIARSIAQSDARARVLVVCVELSTIHLDQSLNRERLIGYSLFGDAAAAFVVCGRADEIDRVCTIGLSRTELFPAGADLLRWDLGSEGFSLSLSDELPAFIHDRIVEFATPLVVEATGGERDPKSIGSWSLHAGGPSVLSHAAEALGLEGTSLDSSWEVLRRAGNLSSATVLFVLERERQLHVAGEPGLMFGFGPGFTMEGLSFTHGGRASATRESSDPE